MSGKKSSWVEPVLSRSQGYKAVPLVRLEPQPLASISSQGLRAIPGKGGVGGGTQLFLGVPPRNLI